MSSSKTFSPQFTGRTRVSEKIPSSAQDFSLRPTYTLEAGSSPTRTKANPGVIPWCLRSAICCGKAPRTFAAIARPSMTLFGRAEVLTAEALDDVGGEHL